MSALERLLTLLLKCLSLRLVLFVNIGSASLGLHRGDANQSAVLLAWPKFLCLGKSDLISRRQERLESSCANAW